MALKASPAAGLFPPVRPTASSSPSTSNPPCSLRVLPLRPSFFGNSSRALRVNVLRLAYANRLRCNGHGATMNLFERFSRVVKSYANALISSFEDPEKILEQTVIEMNSDLTKMRQATAQENASALKTQLDQQKGVVDNLVSNTRKLPTTCGRIPTGSKTLYNL